MIQLSPAAANEVKRLKSKRHDSQLCLRLGVQSSGCSGFSYAMGLDHQVRTDDRVYESGGIQIVVDDASLNYLDGLLIDYSEDLMGGGFRFHNPNAGQTCGCGNSFSLRQSSV
ncbi:HesB/IscA family protein [Pantanalinema rosaneae CENA516]|uniref:HesB/IscA family protein n=1 Tax=Pantanalinema rosaneae TaxID=1620701 RepID=UPI003D700A8C